MDKVYILNFLKSHKKEYIEDNFNLALNLDKINLKNSEILKENIFDSEINLIGIDVFKR